MKETIINAVIVDDEPLSRRVIADLLQPHRDFRIAGEAEDGEAAVELIGRVHPDVVFLDVQMPGMTGFEVLQVLDQEQLPLIVFATAYDQYAVRAFESKALDYLLKPVEEERFRQTITRVRAALLGDRDEWLERLRQLAGEVERPRYRQRIVVRTRDRILFVGVADIDYLEAAGNYVRIHGAGRERLVRMTMAQLESELDPAHFVRVHRSTIVNLDRVTELHPFFRGEFVAVLRSGARLTVQRTYRDQLMKAFEGASFR